MPRSSSISTTGAPEPPASHGAPRSRRDWALFPVVCKRNNLPDVLAQIAPQEVEDPIVDDDVDLDRAWNVVVWNDPVNLMTYVVYVLRKLFGYSEEKATKLMLQVHHEGRAIVSSGPRERAEMDCFRLHRYGLWATLERA